jgi:hypothetical protein
MGPLLAGIAKDDDLACRELHKDLLSLKQLARVLLNTFEAKN